MDWLWIFVILVGLVVAGTLTYLMVLTFKEWKTGFFGFISDEKKIDEKKNEVKAINE